MQEIAKVTSITGSNATVKVPRQEACDGCKACAVGRGTTKFLELEVKNTLNAKAGDTITLDMNTPDLLKAAGIMYGLPLLALIITSMVSYFAVFVGDDVKAGVLGLVATAITYIIIRMNEKNISKNNKFYPTMISIMDDENVSVDGLLDNEEENTFYQSQNYYDN